MSIGSGSGLLEALLLHEEPQLNIYGVEVSSAVNKYLLKERLRLVNGTWDLSSLAKTASTWIFVYPRDVSLVKKYAQTFGEDAVRQVVWIGPLSDFKECEAVFLGPDWIRGDFEDRGFSEYEAMILWRRLELKPM